MCKELVSTFPGIKKARRPGLILSGLLLVVFISQGCDPGGNKVVTKPDSTISAGIKNILFFGNSLTAGQGLDSSASFPSLIQLKIDSFKLPYKTINSGLPGETTAGGVERIDDVLNTSFDIFVLELGGNDGLQKLAVSGISQNLQTIIDKVRKKYPTCKIVLAGMQMPASLGQTYTTNFKTIFPQLAARDSLYLIPFLLDGVGGIPALNQADGIHPNAQGEKIVAENVWRILKPIL